MTKTFKSLLSLFLAVLMVASLVVIPSSAASITLSKSSITLTKGYQTTLTVSGTSQKVTWSTGDKSIATVSSKGVVVGKAPGSTYVYAKVGSSTLKCRVNVVAAKISASTSNVVLDNVGDTKTVTMTIKGSHSKLTVGTTNKKVVSASWVRPIKWDGNNINIKLTAKGEGEAKVKVYLKDYASTCYKYINVTVGEDNFLEEDLGEDNNSEVTISTQSKNVNVDVNATTVIQVYSNDQSNLGYQLSNSGIVKVTAGKTTNNYRAYTITGVKEGTVMLRLYNKENTKKYVDVNITVGGTGTYYQISTIRPTVISGSSDKIITVQVNSANYYMLVPENYDPAYANSVISTKFGKTSYYEVYDKVPAKIASGDQYKEFTNSNITYVNPNYGTTIYTNVGTKRYILVPANYDETKVNTAIAQYNNVYEYWKVYNTKPTVNQAWHEYVESWTVNDSTTGKVINRYMLVSYYDNWSQDRVDQIIANDKNSNNGYAYYTAYNEYPTVNSATDEVVIYTKSGQYRYMVVPKNGTDIIKRNEAIKNDTGVYEAYVMYESSPTANESKGEYVRSAVYGTGRVYVLCTFAPESTQHNLMWAGISTAAPRGN